MKGSHRQFKHPVKSGAVTIAGKLSVDVPKGTLNSGKHQDNDMGSGGKEYDNFQQVMSLISFPPVEDNLVSTELSPVKGVNSVLTNSVLKQAGLKL